MKKETRSKKSQALSAASSSALQVPNEDKINEKKRSKSKDRKKEPKKEKKEHKSHNEKLVKSVAE